MPSTDQQAETALRNAIAVGHEMNLEPRRLAHFYYWLGEMLHWQNRLNDQIRVGREGLALLGKDAASVEAILMKNLIAIGHGTRANTIRLPTPSTDRPDGTLLERRMWYAVFEIHTGGL